MGENLGRSKWQKLTLFIKCTMFYLFRQILFPKKLNIFDNDILFIFITKFFFYFISVINNIVQLRKFNQIWRKNTFFSLYEKRNNERIKKLIGKFFFCKNTKNGNGVIFTFKLQKTISCFEDNIKMSIKVIFTKYIIFTIQTKDYDLGFNLSFYNCQNFFFKWNLNKTVYKMTHWNK